jgi:SNF2 family DNA or RNA helicase
MDDALRILRGWIEMDSEDKNGTEQIHQTVGRKTVSSTKGVICAHEMGLGKTLIAMSALAMDVTELRDTLKCMKRPPKIQALVVLPNTVLYSWESEFEKFFPKAGDACPFKNVLVYHSSNNELSRLPTTSEEFSHYDIILTTFGTFESRFNIFNAQPWEYLVVDEAHHLRNKTTKGNRLINQLRATKALLLTGTPISNKVDDLCSLIEILGIPALLAKQVLLRAMKQEAKAALDKIKNSRHFTLDDDGGLEMDAEEEEGGSTGSTGTAELNRARKLVNRCVLRRRKSDINEKTGNRILMLPGKTVKNVVQSLEGADLMAYKSIETYLQREAQRVELLVKQGKMEKRDLTTKYLAILNKMRQAANHVPMVKDLARMVEASVISNLSRVSTKMRKVLAVTKQLFKENKKVVIFSQ